MELSGINLIVIVLIAVILLSTILYKFSISPVIAYLISGVILGPHALDIISETPQLKIFAEFGVVILMFLVGLEFSFEKLKNLKHHIFVNGFFQVSACATVSFVLIHYAMGYGKISAMITGVSIAMSSTAIVYKYLTDLDDLNKTYGKNAVGILLFQDILLVPMTTLIVALGAGAGLDPAKQAQIIALGLARLIALCFIFYLVGKYILMGIIEWFVKTGIEELKLIAIITIILISAWLARFVGASLPVGAFLVGLIISESKYKSTIKKDLKPFRNTLLSIFFITVGVKLNTKIIINSPILVSSLFLLLTISKFIFVILYFKIKKLNTTTRLQLAFAVSQGGEFTLLLTIYALRYGVISDSLGQALIASTILSMTMACILTPKNRQITLKIMKWFNNSSSKKMSKASK